MKSKTTITDIVCRRICELRETRQMTQSQVSEAAGISVDAMGRIETGGRVPSLYTLERKCLASGMDDYISKPTSKNDLENARLSWQGKFRLVQAATSVVFVVCVPLS